MPDTGGRGVKVVSTIVGVVLMLLYPLAIWIGLKHFGTRTVGLFIVIGVVTTLAIRFRKARRDDLLAVLRVPMVVLAVVIPGVVLDDQRFVLAMPVLINLALLANFGASLFGEHTVIERFARMAEPEPLSAAQIRHCRQVTWVWCGFFLANATVAGVLALAAPLSWWAAYNGGIAYGLMGLLFVIEYVVRQYRFRRYGAGLHDRLLARMFPPPPESAESES